MLNYKDWLNEYEGFSRTEVTPVAASKFKSLIERSTLDVTCSARHSDGSQEFYFHGEKPEIRSRFNTTGNAKIVVWVDYTERNIIYETKRGGSTKRMVVGTDDDFDALVDLLTRKCSETEGTELDDDVDSMNFFEA